MQRPKADDILINDKDINALMETVYGMDRRKGLDLILHTPGGETAATEHIIKYLQDLFNGNIRAIVPQMAMSAGSLISVSCKEIIMGKESCLGPFDPQFGGIACQSLIQEFETAKMDLKKNPQALGLWQVIISKYNPTLLNSCQKAVNLTEELAKNFLKNSLVDQSKLKKALDKFNDNEITKTHNRHISKAECKEVGLNIIDLESNQELQDAVLSLHHCYMITFDTSNFAKILENNLGNSYASIINSTQTP
jgi:ClpP class serine protease